MTRSSSPSATRPRPWAPARVRMCQLAAIRLMADETGQSLGGGGHHHRAARRGHSVPMGALAGRPFEPAKRSSIHGRSPGGGRDRDVGG